MFTLITLTAGVVAALMVTRYVARHSGGTTVPTTTVVVAATDIPLATTLTPEMVKVVDWPSNALPAGSFPAVNLLDGRVTGIALVAGDTVVESRLSSKGSGLGMAALVPPNMRAMTVQVNAVIGVSGFLHPGDIVDVITTMQAPRTGADDAQEYRSKIVLQNIRVLAVGEHLVTDKKPETESKAESVTVVTLLVSPAESERLALASTQGKLLLTMRSQADNAAAETAGVSPSDLLGAGDAGARPVPSARASSVPVSSAASAEPPVAVRPARAVVAAHAAKPAPTVETIEVLRGDKIEQRKMAPRAP